MFIRIFEKQDPQMSLVCSFIDIFPYYYQHNNQDYQDIKEHRFLMSHLPMYKVQKGNN